MALKTGEIVEFPCGSIATVADIDESGVELDYCHQTITVKFQSIPAIRKLLTRIEAKQPGCPGKGKPRRRR